MLLAADWDANPWLLATPGGTVDLKAGKLRAADPADHCTKITAVAPEGDCPRWLAFLDQIMAGDQDLASFLQRVCGYALTGSTKHHALFFCYGTGGNGKGVFLNTIAGIMGAYAKTAAMNTFAASANESHPTDIASLKGARLAISQETEQGQAWPEAKIKAMTGGDVLSARFMRQDFFEFTPQFKLVIAGNYKPELRNVDEAIRRRFHMIPFTISIPREQQDENLPEKLRAEWPGILRWAIAGCLDWQRIGLAPPRAVTIATDEYLASEDSLSKWVEECCIRDRNLQSASSALFANWSAWCEAQNERRGSQKQWHARMVAGGFRAEHGRGGTAFAGIGLKAPAAQEWEPGR
jgi:putative DNA primase/helicase